MRVKDLQRFRSEVVDDLPAATGSMLPSAPPRITLVQYIILGLVGVAFGAHYRLPMPRTVAAPLRTARKLEDTELGLTTTTTAAARGCDKNPNLCEQKRNENFYSSPNPYDGVCVHISLGSDDVRCGCNTGFANPEGLPSECRDTDECATGTHTCDSSSSTCKNLVGDYRCECNEGYEQGATNKECETIDFCNRDPSLCSPGGHCVNIPGSFHCECDPKHWQPGTNNKSCIDINECLQNPNPCEIIREILAAGAGPNPFTGLCENLPGNFKCDCSSGFTTDDDPQRCFDYDECFYNTHTCDLFTMNCINQPGTYECVCKDGFVRSSSNICVDINECAEGVNGNPSVVACDRATARCRNTQGAYECDCYSGYRSVYTSASLATGCRDCCEDIDECADGSNACSDTCQFGTVTGGASLGSNYTCSCNEHRYLMEDQRRCAACQWSDWSEYGSCNVTCGNGFEISSRTALPGHGEGSPMCNQPNQVQRLLPCQMPPCNAGSCTVAPWTHWSECTAECGGGIQNRTRVIISENVAGGCADVATSESMECNTVSCGGMSVSDVDWLTIGLAGGGITAIIAILVPVINRLREPPEESL